MANLPSLAFLHSSYSERTHSISSMPRVYSFSRPKRRVSSVMISKSVRDWNSGSTKRCIAIRPLPE
ncbi:Uncharacterised protein [Vibrio cholerae]|nr:Uncharacterised protein [Vibrio cholerae]CSI59781.1 Uncharacterised protein [Vibrio cholerae]